MMTKPTGKLLFAYNTIASLNEHIAELEAVIRGRDELINNAVSSRIAELEKERDEFKAIACSITPEIIDFVRCGIGANYGGSCYTEKMEKTYAPILASFKALKEQDNG
jgi:hypothetical protein